MPKAVNQPAFVLPRFVQIMHHARIERIFALDESGAIWWRLSDTHSLGDERCEWQRIPEGRE